MGIVKCILWITENGSDCRHRTIVDFESERHSENGIWLGWFKWIFRIANPLRFSYLPYEIPSYAEGDTNPMWFADWRFLQATCSNRLRVFLLRFRHKMFFIILLLFWQTNAREWNRTSSADFVFIFNRFFCSISFYLSLTLPCSAIVFFFFNSDRTQWKL